MTQTRTETLALTDGTGLPITVAEPDNVVRGGLVVLHEERGITERVRLLVSALAEEGWLTVAPHLYHRHENGAEVPDRSLLSHESILVDTDATFVWLADHGIRPDYQGVIGYEIGGTAALVVAANRTLGAAVTVQGGGILTPTAASLPALVEIAGEVTCPWLGLYAEDGAIPTEEINKLREVADGAGVATDVVQLPRHAFEDAETGGESWQRARNWFDLHLR